MLMLVPRTTHEAMNRRETDDDQIKWLACFFGRFPTNFTAC